MLDLGGADAERQGAERAVGGGVGVAADHGEAGLGQAQLGADDVDDALLGVAQRVQADAELGAVGPQCLDLRARGGIRDRLVDVQRRGVVVLRGDGQVGPTHRTPGQTQPLEGLRARHLVHQVQVDVEQIRGAGGALALAAHHHVFVPDLLGQRPGSRRRRRHLPHLPAHAPVGRRPARGAGAHGPLWGAAGSFSTTGRDIPYREISSHIPEAAAACPVAHDARRHPRPSAQ